jgi:hypothetical protein
MINPSTTDVDDSEEEDDGDDETTNLRSNLGATYVSW